MRNRFKGTALLMTLPFLGVLLPGAANNSLAPAETGRLGFVVESMYSVS